MLLDINWDADAEVHSVSSSNMRLVSYDQSEDCHPETQAVPQVCFWGQSLSFSGSSVRTGPNSVKCMDATLAPMGLQSVRVLNYLNDWLILVQLQEFAICHRDLVLNHLQSLELRLNPWKSMLLLRQ